MIYFLIFGYFWWSEPKRACCRQLDIQTDRQAHGTQLKVTSRLARFGSAQVRLDALRLRATTRNSTSSTNLVLEQGLLRVSQHTVRHSNRTLPNQPRFTLCIAFVGRDVRLELYIACVLPFH